MNPKPLLFPFKKPTAVPMQRLAEREIMTLIAAFSGAGGLALFADSQETISGYAKKRISKIEVRSVGPERNFSFAVAGAGNAVHIDRLKFELEGELYKLDTYDVSAFHGLIDRTALKYFQERIWPRASDRPEFELLVVTHSENGAHDLFYVADGAATWIDGGHKCIGIGSYLADYLLERFDGHGSQSSEMIGRAAYVLGEVKDHVDGVGLDSVICMFRTDGGFDYVEQFDLDHAGPLFEHFNRLLAHTFDATFDTTNLASKPEAIAAELRRLSEQYRKWLDSKLENQTKDMMESGKFHRRMLEGDSKKTTRSGAQKSAGQQ